MEEKKNKKSKIIKGVALLGLFLLVFGVSYALFSVVLNGTKRNRITTGNLGLILTDTSGTEEKDLPEGMMGINLEEAFPMTKEEGLKTEPYKFVVKNTGSIPVSYTLKLKDIEGVENTLRDEYIRYNLITQDYLKEYEEGDFAQGYFSTEKTWNEDGTDIIDASLKLSDTTDRVLDATTLLPGESMEYTLNLWLDYEATTEQAANKTFEGKIEIKGEQATVHTTGASGEKIDYTLYNDGTLILTGEGEVNGFVFDENGDNIIDINNNGSPIFDILYQYAKKEKINLNPITMNTIEGYITFMQLYLGTTFDQSYETQSIQEDLGISEETQKMIFNDLPKINRIVIKEGITKVSSYLVYFPNKMVTLPMTLQKIDGVALVGTKYLNIPNTVDYVGELGLGYGIRITIDNSKEYADTHFEEGWNSGSTIIYLR